MTVLASHFRKLSPASLVSGWFLVNSSELQDAGLFPAKRLFKPAGLWYIE